MIDLRSDTVTLPSPAMRDAIARAELGDDVYGEDPTINRLQNLAAELMGKEAALLVPSGTMGNLAALLAHGARGQRVIAGSESHIFHYEGGGASALGGLVYDLVRNHPDGTLDAAELHEALAHGDDDHVAPAGVICLENTHNRCGGAVLDIAYMQQIHTLAQQHRLPLHLDGARIFNAAVALDVDVHTLAQHTDTVQFCLSKGLAAPVGSLVAGPRAFIARVHRVRKMLGGGMRQAGVIAAAGLLAITEMVQRLPEDHAHARQLAEGLAALPGVRIDPARVQTNIVIFELEASALPAAHLIAALRERGVLMNELGSGRVRAVTHYGLSADDIQATLAHIGAVLRAA